MGINDLQYSNRGHELPVEPPILSDGEWIVCRLEDQPIGVLKVEG
jgi:hypothetical protein